MSGYAVIHLSTTGPSPRHHDRVTEIAVVRLSADGHVQDEWSTLVNPQRALGTPDGGPESTDITAFDVRHAPTFPQIAPFVVDLLRGRVLVAHHVAFTRAFLHHELRLAGIHAPVAPETMLGTMHLAGLYLPAAPRGLAICCELAGVPHDGQRGALVDARASAGLLQYYREIGTGEDHWDRAAQAVDAQRWQRWDVVVGVDPVRRRTSRPAADAWTTLADRLDRAGSPELDEYLGLVDLLLLDGRAGADDAGLRRAATDAGLGPGDVDPVHRAYLHALAAAATGGLTTHDAATHDAAARTVRVVAARLGLDATDLPDTSNLPGTPALSDTEALSDTPALAHPSQPVPALRRGDEIVLTGTLQRARSAWESAARGVGLLPWNTVTGRTRLVVAADPDALSGAVRSARHHGIPLLTENAFEALLKRTAPL